MRLLLLALVATAVCALPSADLPDSVVPETGLVDTNAFDPAKEAQAAITVMLQEGKDEGACASLASATIKEVEDGVAGQQKILNALDTGASCPSEGQAGVDAAQNSLNSATSALSDAQKAFNDANAAPVSVGPQAFSSLQEGNCAFFFSDPAYTSAKEAFKTAKDQLEKAKGAKASAETALATAKEAQKKAIRECQCDVRSAYNKAWKAANTNNDENEKAYTKGKHMKCVLEGTPPASCSVGSIPKVTAITLDSGVPAEACAKHVSYIGCFGDNEHRDLKHGPKNYGYSPVTCRDACKGYKYFALQNGGWCNCDNSYSDGYVSGQGKSSYNEIGNFACDGTGNTVGRGMGGGWTNAIYHVKDSHDTALLDTQSDFENWHGSCSTTADYIQCNQGANQMRAKKNFNAPLTVTMEMVQHDNQGDECGVFQVFGDANNRHGHYSVGMGWWQIYLGFGYNSAEGHGIWQLKDGSTKRWRQLSVSVHTNGVATYWVDGQKYATKQGHATSGTISIGMNCRNYKYRNIQVKDGNW